MVYVEGLGVLHPNNGEPDGTLNWKTNWKLRLEGASLLLTGFGVWGFHFKVWDFGFGRFKVFGLEFRICDVGFWV